MDQLKSMEVFVSVAELGSFSAAAKKLNIPLPSVSRKVADLEQHLGAQLLVRSTRKISLTSSGLRFLESSKQILDDLKEAERQASNEYLHPRGRLTISAPSFFGQIHILPIVRTFLEEYPDVSIKLQLSDKIVHLLDDHIDLGLRIGRLSDSSMIAKPLGHVRYLLCASPEYLEKHGIPETPDDLMMHQCIQFTRHEEALNQWPFSVSGEVIDYPINSPLTINSTAGALDTAINHFGISRILSYQAAQAIAEGKLRIVLDEYSIQRNPVSFIYPQGRHIPLKLRAFIDYATPILKQRLKQIEKTC